MAVAGAAVLNARALSNVCAPSVHAYVKVLIAIWSLLQRSYYHIHFLEPALSCGHF